MNSLSFPTSISCTPCRTGAPADQQEQACLRAWRLVRGAGERLPAAPQSADPALARALQEAFNAGRLPGVLIEAELQRALRCGPSDATLLALMLLAAMALDRLHGAGDALALAQQCAELARQPQAAAVAAPVLRAHAALVLARVTSLREAALLQAEACRLDAPRPDSLARNAVLWTGMRLLCGAPLSELLYYAEAVRQASRRDYPDAGASIAACQLDGRIALFRLFADGGAAAPGAPAALALPEAPQFGCWLTRLQVAYLRGNTALALAALEAAASLRTPLTAPCEILPFHLFAALALADAGDAAARLRLRAHRRALQGWARRSPAHVEALGALALAAGHEADQDAAALGSYEHAAALARDSGQAWVAALAWERAAGLCARMGMQVAVPVYRRLALDAWRDWGAHGRVRELMLAWDAQAAPARPSGQGEEARATRADTVGELGIAIAHEVNQPLAAILLHAAAARRWLRRPQPDPGRALDALEQITACGRQAGDIIRSVRGLARRQNDDMNTFAIDPALAEVAQLLRALMQRQEIRFETRLGLPGLQLHANRAQLQQILMNLLLNAIEALAAVHDRPRRIVLESAALGSAQVELRVLDNGPGVAQEERARIFDALYSTKPHGSGVGLSISSAIAEAHGGRLEFVPAEPQGAMFRVVLPLRSAPATAQPGDRHHA